MGVSSDEEGEQEEGSENGHLDLFQEPNDYYLPDKPATFTEYELRNGLKVQLRLVGHNPLWGHLLWNAGKVLSNYLEDNAHTLLLQKTVLELGAGAGLPSLTCAITGASKVVVTDYPDLELIENLKYNIVHCEALPSKEVIVAQGYLWGNDVAPLTACLGPDKEGFDLLILADILFNHSEHDKLVATVVKALKRSADAKALVFFTPYRPWLYQKDMHFFELAKSNGLEVNKLLEHMMDRVMFEEDPGDELMRRTVHGYEVKWPSTVPS